MVFPCHVATILKYSSHKLLSLRSSSHSLGSVSIWAVPLQITWEGSKRMFFYIEQVRKRPRKGIFEQLSAGWVGRGTTFLPFPYLPID